VKPAPFEYHRPDTLEEALSLMAELGDEAKPLAGGQSLVPLLAMRLAQPAHIVDLERVPELRGVERNSGGVIIRAMTRQSEIVRQGAELDLPAAVREAVLHIGHFQIRNRGTVGGSITHGDPAAEWPALLLLLDASITACSARAERTIAATDFYLGPLMTALEPDELVVDIRIPSRSGASAFAEVERRHGDFALVGAACDAGRVAVFGAGSRPQRLPQVESFIAADRVDLGELARLAEVEIEAVSDIHASAAYRKKVGGELVAGVVSQCLA
jgi:carbon-monoxide dehydrogenase medium subunit